MALLFKKFGLLGSSQKKLGFRRLQLRYNGFIIKKYILVKLPFFHVLCCHLVIYLYSANKKIIKTLFLRGKFLVRLFHLILSEYCEDPSVVTKIEQRIFLFKGTVSRYVAGLKGFQFNKFIQNKQPSKSGKYISG